MDAVAVLSKAEAYIAAGETQRAVLSLYHAAGLLDAEAAAAVECSQSESLALSNRAAACRARALALQVAKAEADARAKRDADAAVARAKLDADALYASQRPDNVASASALAGLLAATALGPVSALLAAGAVAVASSRSDNVGSLIRAVGDKAADAVASTREFDREHGISAKVKQIGETVQARVTAAEDRLIPTHPNAAAAIGTVSAFGGFVVSNTGAALAAAHLTMRTPHAAGGRSVDESAGATAVTASRALAVTTAAVAPVASASTPDDDSIQQDASDAGAAGGALT